MTRKREDPNVRRVFDSDVGKVEPDERDRSAPSGVRSGEAVVRMRRETSGRGGKTVTSLRGFGLGAAELAELGRALKKRCGTGGTVGEDLIEIQGDHRDLLEQELVRRGFRVKRAGG